MLVAILGGRTGLPLSHSKTPPFYLNLTRPTALLAPASIGCLRGTFDPIAKQQGIMEPADGGSVVTRNGYLQTSALDRIISDG